MLGGEIGMESLHPSYWSDNWIKEIDFLIAQDLKGLVCRTITADKSIR
jgi:hypothetical protein